MAIVLIALELNEPEQRYESIENYFSEFEYFKCQRYVWLLDTEISLREITTGFINVKGLSTNDSFFVVTLYKDCGNFVKVSDELQTLDFYKWIEDPSRNW